MPSTPDSAGPWPCDNLPRVLRSKGPGDPVISRRAFLATAGVGLVSAPAGARAQPAGKIHRIGFLSLQSGLTFTTEAFHQGLREVGYVEGRSLIIEYRWAA